jgi:hypothetical protein
MAVAAAAAATAMATVRATSMVTSMEMPTATLMTIAVAEIDAAAATENLVAKACGN